MMDTDYRSRLDKAISRLMRVTSDGESVNLSVPILYPSGSSAAVNIAFNAGKCFVSDLALGQMEAEMHGADTFYDAVARKAASRFHVEYDGVSIFATWASIDRIEAAILSVANASAFAASSSIYKAVEDKDRKKNDELYQRVSRLFGATHVVRQTEVSGENATWTAHNVVMFDSGKRGVFEFVSDNQTSIASKFMMFSDLVRKPEQFTLTSVVTSVERMGSKGAMLQDVSEVLQINAEDAYFLRRAA